MTTECTVPAPPVSTSARTALPAAFLGAAGLLLLAHLPLVVLHLRQIWLRPHYQFFPLVLLGSVILLLSRLRELGPLTPGSRGWALALLGLGWVLLAAAELLYSSWLATVAALVTLAGALFACGGGRLLRQALPALILLALVIPPPLELDRNLILWLQGLTAHWSSRVLDLLGVHHLMAGHVVEIAGRKLLVEEACSGINSLFSVLACTLFLAFYVRRSPLHTLLLVAAAVGWVLLANVARVVISAWSDSRFGVNLGEGWAHEALGVFLFVAALGLVWSTDCFLRFVSLPSNPRENAAAGPLDGTEPAPAPVPPGWRPHLPWPVAAAFALLFLAHVALHGTGSSGNRAATPSIVGDGLAKLSENTLPTRWGPWQRESFDTLTRNPGSAFGEHSKTWTYRRGESTALFSLDYPFPGWHDLTRCYTSQGWVLDSQTTTVPAAGGKAAAGVVEVRLSKPGYRYGYLLFSQFDDAGKALEARRGGLFLSLHRHRSVLRDWWSPAPGAPDEFLAETEGTIYQAQLFVEAYQPLTGTESAAARAFFDLGLGELRRSWTDENKDAQARWMERP